MRGERKKYHVYESSEECLLRRTASGVIRQRRINARYARGGGTIRADAINNNFNYQRAWQAE